MKVYLHQIETETPRHVYSQGLIAEKLSSWMGDSSSARKIRAVFRRAGIESRYSVLPDFSQEEEAKLFRVGMDGRVREPSTAERNDCYSSESKPLLGELGNRILANCCNFVASDITHVITVSCTGFYNPGPDLDLINQVGLRPDTERYHLGFMGCYAAFPAMRMAHQFCLADPSAVVLIVCLELCSLHMRLKNSPDSMLANALFGDGAAATLVSARVPSGTRPYYTLNAFLSALAPETENHMAWSVGNTGFDLSLSAYVPDLLSLNVPAVIGELVGRSSQNFTEFDDWAIHPGGRSILDKLEQSLGIQSKQIAASRSVLRQFGNMSSATILFVLKELLESSNHRSKKVCAMAFGPGLTIETARLQLVPARVPAIAEEVCDGAEVLEGIQV